jgi:hypothetical protein
VKPSRVVATAGALAAAVALGGSLLVGPVGASPALPALVSANPVNYTPNLTGSDCYVGLDPTLCRRILDVARVGNTVYAGGVIGDVKNANGTSAGTYGNALAFDALTGAVKSDFGPIFVGASGQIYDGPVNAVERSTYGTAVWFGGEFKKLNGIGARGLVRWDVASNSLYTAFQPQIGADGGPAKVYDVKYFCGRLWVAGDFTSAGGVVRTALVSLDPTTGAATDQVNLDITGTAGPSSGPTRVFKMAASPDCKRVVITGNFTRISGHERYQLAVLDVSPTTGVATLAPWYSPYHLRASQPGVGSDPCSPASVPVWGRDIDWAPDGTWWALATTGGHHRHPALCDSVSRWSNIDSGDARPVWINYSGGDTFMSVRVTGAHVYVGGHIRYLDHAVYRGGVKVYAADHVHYGLGALYATWTSGLAVPSWNAGSNTGRGAGWTGMLVSTGGAGTASGLWVGGDDEKISGELGKRIALLPLYR